MDRLDLFRVFIRVVETEGFSRAAASLNMPRSSVSTAIRQLENRLGTRLLTRTTRQVTPTPDGLAFYEQVSRLVADAEDVEMLFRKETGQPKGILRVDVPVRIGRLVLVPALPRFLELHPDMDIMLSMTDRTVNPAEDGIDCTLRVGSLPDSSLIASHVVNMQVCNVASPLYLARHGVPESPADLPGHLAVRYASPTTGRIESWEWCSENGSGSRAMSGRVTVNNAEALIACCLAGLGMIQVPAYDVREHLERCELVELMPAWRPEPLPLTLLYPERRHLSARVQVFAAWLKELLPDLEAGAGKS